MSVRPHPVRTDGRQWLLVIVVMVASCTGGSSAPNRSGAGSGNQSGGSPGGVGMGGEMSGPCVTGEAFHSPLRRLTRVEYNNTVRDLLGDSSAPADRFPPDEVSGGFSNNAAVLTVSPLLAEKYQEAAEALAAKAIANLGTLVGCDVVRTGEEACARQFVERFGARAYRRPLTAAEVDRLLRVYAAGRAGATFARGIEVTLRAILQAPSFLYRLEGGMPGRPGEKLVRLTSHEVATRLSYLLWATMPSGPLVQAADRNELTTPAQVSGMARTMLSDPRARTAIVEFYRQWLGLRALDQLSKDPRIYPEFNDELRAALQAETPALVEDLLFAGDHKLATLLTQPVGFVTPALAALYGVSPSALTGAGPQRVLLRANERAGVLTQAGVLAVHALPGQSSPIHRGKFVRERLLCQELPQQPPDLMVSPPEVDPQRPTRERFAEHARSAACSVCHRLMDPIGFGFESYDGVGRFRATDGGRTVDASGELVETRDANGPFEGARALALRLAASGEVRDCVATQWYRFAFGRFDGPGDACSLRALRASFAASGEDLRELLVALTQTEAFLHRPALTAEVMP
jgi:hypothetical protein